SKSLTREVKVIRPYLIFKVLGFDWKNCGPPDAPAVLKTLTMSPDPISIPGDLTASASGSTVVELGAPLSVSTLIYGCYWTKVSNHITQLQLCGYLCDQSSLPALMTLPLCSQGSYTLPQSIFYLPNIDLPYWLTNGDYRVQGVLGSQGKELGCLKVTLSIHSD
uniref:Ganglioside GM2 activator n=1 Tax=Neolamprologus brichardi TaxID=32507 RepID=A0A3Q4MRZ6_NEOBR